MIYLNAGHTGLHEPALKDWISKNEVRAVHLIHDLIPITRPQFCRPGEAKKHSDRMRHALESATGIIGNSQDTLDELATFASSVQLAMPASVAAWISGVQISEPVVARSLGRPHFVSIGTIEGRKNHVLLLNVWRHLVARLGDQAPILILIGQRGWEADEATTILDGEQGLNGHVREFSRCEDRDLLDLLSGATALLMPSFAEGFGLPIIEALQVGTPVIASDLPVFRELAGDIPEYLHPSDADGWEAAIQSFMARGADYQRQKSRMSGYLAPTWQEHFAIVDDWLSKLPSHKIVRAPRQQSGNFDRD
ncbi:MAG TPA: glycosyltransferase family 1 protein [Sphingomicrobium sp.]|nr:glycosyltransferase family 1 protein [Sphingomicrobium sp.]